MYQYVWIGNQLAQEWLDGVLIKEYIYTIHGSLPTRLRIYDNTGLKKEMDILFDGRGNIKILVDSATQAVLQTLKTNGFGHTVLDTHGLPSGSGKPNMDSIFSSILNAMNGVGSRPTPIDMLNQHQSRKTRGFNNKMESIFGHSPASIQDDLTGNKMFGGGHGNSLINLTYARGKSPHFIGGHDLGLYTYLESNEIEAKSNWQSLKDVSLIGMGSVFGGPEMAPLAILSFAAYLVASAVVKNFDQKDALRDELRRLNEKDQ